VLEVLLRRRGEVVPKSEILTHVWDENEDVDPNVVEVYVGYLRRKIDAPYGKTGLQTVRGVGYRLAADGE
jgi:two-component system OmpR family response regulator